MQTASDTRSRLARRLSWLVVAGMTTAALVGPSASPVLADEHDKVTLCHAAGLDDTLTFTTLTISWNAAFGVAGHFDENGTPNAGHEQDYLGPCSQPEPTPTPTPDATPTPTPTPDATPTPTPDATPTPTPNLNPTPTPSPNPTPTPTPTPTPQPTPTPTPVPTPEATPTPEGEVLAEVGTPKVTLPPTDTLSGSTQAPAGDSWRLILLAMAGILATSLLLTPATSVARRRDR